MDTIISGFENLLTWFVNTVDGPLWDITILLLLGVGMFFTITTGLVQLRLLPRSIREMWGGRAAEGDSLTPFQAFATGLASRVGVGILDVGYGIYWDEFSICRINFSAAL